jgi:DNA-binding protein YbaB
VQVNLKLEVVKIEVKPELWAEKPEVVIELMVAAINQGLHLAKEGAKQAMLEASKNMGFPFAK